MRTPKFWTYMAVMVATICIGLAWTWPRIETPQADRVLRSPFVGRVSICLVGASQDDFKKWLGNDYGDLVIFGSYALRMFEILARPEDKEKALKRVESIAKEHKVPLYK